MVQTRTERSPSPVAMAIVRFPPSIKSIMKAPKRPASLELDAGALAQDGDYHGPEKRVKLEQEDASYLLAAEGFLKGLEGSGFEPSNQMPVSADRNLPIQSGFAFSSALSHQTPVLGSTGLESISFTVPAASSVNNREHSSPNFVNSKFAEFPADKLLQILDAETHPPEASASSSTSSFAIGPSGSANVVGVHTHPSLIWGNVKPEAVIAFTTDTASVELELADLKKVVQLDLKRYLIWKESQVGRASSVGWKEWVGIVRAGRLAVGGL